MRIIAKIHRIVYYLEYSLYKNEFFPLFFYKIFFRFYFLYINIIIKLTKYCPILSFLFYFLYNITTFIMQKFNETQNTHLKKLKTYYHDEVNKIDD
jgi:hypothetical protein